MAWSKQSFAKSANLSGAIITKLDGTSRGGVSLAVSEEVNFLSVYWAGEGIKDLRPLIVMNLLKLCLQINKF